MSKGRIVWSDEAGDLRKHKSDDDQQASLNLDEVTVYLRRLTTGKGRTVIELSNLPRHKSWCKTLAKECKKKLGVGGSYKNDVIEVHGEKMNEVMALLTSKGIKFKKIGG